MCIMEKGKVEGDSLFFGMPFITFFIVYMASIEDMQMELEFFGVCWYFSEIWFQNLVLTLLSYFIILFFHNSFVPGLSVCMLFTLIIYTN